MGKYYVVVDNRSVDIYINGNLDRSVFLPNVPGFQMIIYMWDRRVIILTVTSHVLNIGMMH